MFSRLSPLLRAVPPLPPSCMAARVLSRPLPSIATLPSRLSSPPAPRIFPVATSYLEAASLFGRRRLDCNNGSRVERRFGGTNGNVVAAAGRREYRKVRSRRVAAAKKSKEKELELSVRICLEEQLPEDPEIMVLSIFACVWILLLWSLIFLALYLHGFFQFPFQSGQFAIFSICCF